MFTRDLDTLTVSVPKKVLCSGGAYKSILTRQVTFGERKVYGRQLKWSVFRDFPVGKVYSTMQEWLFPFIKNPDGKKNSIYTKCMDSAIFK